ncbi:MAG: rod shape-determining protein MreC, partial [Gemmatimonadetes bacterium]|nr:rod shape-determining protein MreC [Gemmatimonadota bacterium]
MTFASERYASRRDTLAFIVCLLLSVAARMTPTAWHDRVSEGLRGTLLRPLVAMQGWAESVKITRQRFARVVAERDSAAVVATLADALREENAQLRAVLGLRERLPTRHVAAEVLHQSLPTDGYTLLISAGSRQGVRVLAPVIASGGLVGVVRSVGGSTSVVVAWAHPDFRASAMTADGAVFGIAAPYGGGDPGRLLLELRGVPYREQLIPGTRVYTSGLATGEGGIYPRGIPIGTILSVGEELAGWARTY